MEERSSGVLLHISSLPGEFGIGDFGSGAYNFVDFLYRSGQKNWQILPLGITSYGDSPYQSFSAFAGNPYFIDLNEFIGSGFISKEEVEKFDFGEDPSKVNYGLLYENKIPLLKQAYRNSKDLIIKDLEGFVKENYGWIRDFALFMAIKESYGNVSWLEWDKKYKAYNSEEVLDFEKEYKDEIYFWIFTQYYFWKQWKKLKKYANKKDVKIIGDLPIYVSTDSVDVWKDPHLFKLDKDFQPITVAGVPSDDFSELGQLWGNPTYDWENMEKEGYSWWVDRIHHSFKQFDILRIDHFKGFESFWEVEFQSKDARKGKWRQGPGIELFRKIEEELGSLDIVAEDLGFNTENLEKLVSETGFPNMKILQFGFNHKEENNHMVHQFKENMLAYTGTHDNQTIMGWFKEAGIEDKEYVEEYFKLDKIEGYNWGIIRGLWSSVARLTIVPLQDILGLDNGARMNTPAILGGNWTWRYRESMLKDRLARKLKDLTELYWR